MFGLSPVGVANVVLAGTTAFFFGYWLVEKLFARNARRATARVIGTALVRVGVPESITDIFFSYSDGDYPEFWGHVKRIVKLLNGDPKNLLDILRGVLKHMAGSPEGLKLIKDIVAAAEVPATPAPAAA